MGWVGDKRLYARSLELLFSQSTGAFISSSIAGLVLIFSFWSVTNPLVSLIWCGGYASIACYRIYLRRQYLAEDESLRQNPKWFGFLGVSVFLTGLLWGGYLLYLAIYADGFWAVILVANVAFILAGAVIAYAISLPIFLLFSLPIVVPAIGYLIVRADQNHWLLAAVSLGWYLFMVSSARRFGDFAMRALAYEYHNRELVADLEEQNRRAEVLADELLVLSNTDSLTGLFNRRYFDERLRDEMLRSVRTGLTVSLILCDVDYFKVYNDTLGHQEGDRCLKRIAEILFESVRGSSDVVARYGGEEFAVILVGADLKQARVFAERLRKLIVHYEIPHPRSTVGSFVTMSLGVASTKSEGDEVDDLIGRADQALYMAKECGRNQVQVAVS